MVCIISSKDKYYSIQVLLNRMLQDVQFLMSSSAGDSSELAKDIPSVSLKMAVGSDGELFRYYVFIHFFKNIL